MTFGLHHSPARRTLRTIMIGVALTTGVVMASPATEAAGGLYDQIRDITLRQYMLTQEKVLSVELPIKEFTEKSGIDGFDVPVTKDDIDDLLNGRDAACKDKPTVCPQVRDATSLLVLQEEEIQKWGFKLQMIATSFEAPLMGDASVPIAARMQAIGMMWSADVDNDEDTETDSRIQFRIADKNVVEGMFRTLGNDLTALVRLQSNGRPDATLQTAAVWRYRFGGVQWIEAMESGGPTTVGAPQPEQALLHERWTTIENSLRDIRNALLGALGDSPPTEGESLLFLFPPSVEAHLPSNIRVWAYVERNENGLLTGDAGLQFIHALEPVQPLLCKRPDNATGQMSNEPCKPIKGGRYPPPLSPQQPQPFCTYPSMRAGYLCSPVKTSTPNTCKNTINADANSVVLTTCESGEKVKEVPTGGDVCQNPEWQRGATDTTRPGYWDTHCTIELSCIDTGSDSFTGPKSKTSDGKVIVELSETPQLSPVHFLLGGLASTQFICNKPMDATLSTAGNVGPDNFCKRYTDLMQKMCDAMAQDGILEFGRQRNQGQDFLFNRDMCAQIMTDHFVRSNEKKHCPGLVTEHLDDETVQALADKIKNTSMEWIDDHNSRVDVKKNPEQFFPKTCSEIKNPPEGRVRDLRIDAAIRALERSGDEVCKPLADTAYRNSIGNTMCYLNRCLQESMEDYRLTPGRTTFNAGDLAFPYDLCLRQPQELLPVIPAISPDGDWVPPAYKPGLLLRRVQQELCPGSGLGTTVCTWNPYRRLNLTSKDYIALGSDIQRQEQEYQEPGIAYGQLSKAIGSRIGNGLYNDYLEKRAKTLTDFARTAATLLLQFPKVHFPDALCPTDRQDILSLCTENWEQSTQTVSQ